MRVLFIDIDTLRADHMGCYGYGRDTTPNMDAIADRGIRFDRYYCPNAPCLPSRASLVSGQYGIRTGVVGHGGTASDMRVEGYPRSFKSEFALHNLVQEFRSAGYLTASVSTFAERHSSFWFNAGFNEIYNVGKSGNELGSEVTDYAADWLTRNGDRDDWFLHVHYWDPHTPYRTPEEYGEPFKDDALPDAWLDEETFRKHKKLASPHGANEIGMFDDSHPANRPRHPGRLDSMEEYKKFVDNYDLGIRYTDDQIGILFDTLLALGIDPVNDDDFAVIITSDHGENMGELGVYAEHGTADEPTCRIPMIVKWPGAKKGVERAYHTNVDLCPTVAELLGNGVWEGYDGVSFAESVKLGGDHGSDYAILSQCAHVCQRSVRFTRDGIDWLYIRTVHDGYHSNFETEMLFDITNDPHEQYELARTRPDLCAYGSRLILDWTYEQMKRSHYDADPMWTVMREGGPFHSRGYLKDYLARLRADGRGEAADIIEKRHPDEIDLKV